MEGTEILVITKLNMEKYCGTPFKYPSNDKGQMQRNTQCPPKKSKTRKDARLLQWILPISTNYSHASLPHSTMHNVSLHKLIQQSCTSFMS